MTWSVAAHDPKTGAFAVAIATCAFAVGASCPFVRSGVGAASTQSITNRYLGPAVLDAMARGLPAADAIESALAGDAGRGVRQLHAVDRQGRAAAHTGANCVEWCGEVAGERVSVAGNMLAGPAVVTDTLARYQAETTLPLPERLLAAMDAGQQAGGDRRGQQSAALLLTTTQDFPDIDLRVDDHPKPLDELRRLLALWRCEREPELSGAPSEANPSGRLDLNAIEAVWRARGLDLRFRR